MIASMSGVVEALGLDHAVLAVGGVGVRIEATPATLASLRVGAAARLATSLVVREESLTLFGFADDDERAVFEAVQTVSGVGPRLALAMVAVHTPDLLRRAVAEEDLAALQRVPGIGKKGAQRIVLELGDKLGPPTGGSAPAPATTDAEVPGGLAAEVAEALTQLGWNDKQAGAAVTAVLDSPDAPAADDRAAVLRAALQHLAGARRG
ncbi:Holliday junction branch migration protein RuvA [Bogoriella caseilytica]|uniref:Holliday junction branch migration complex subunit RuvA n=1 Tax=Bogoriella caseilytica TaxID=56055 RepID=A0A3N2BGD7_9MICO|nr:Holliday junction branch migration protein RuvA [Bogoriella caseilytica]ROR74322.1 Holliday junction DNA helicase subunit RuvA [Bogoriella caseilytica]